MKVYQHLRASNDTNGNPRRLWVVYDVRKAGCEIVKVYDEGYHGRPSSLRGLPQLPCIEITPSEYRSLK